MNPENPVRVCKRCQKPVVVYYRDYDLFEQMHWLCFHLEYEHDTDPDEPCMDPSCPWWHIEVYKKAIVRQGLDPEQIIGQAIAERWK